MAHSTGKIGKDSTKQQLRQAVNFQKNMTPKKCERSLTTDGMNMIAAGTYDIPLGVTLTVSVDDELVVI